MKFVIPRGIIYHRVIDDLTYLFRSFFSRLNQSKSVSEFERAFAELVGSKHCVAFPFARTAIYFSLKFKNLSPGSEVIMPPISIKGILDVVLALGLKPVFVDLNPNTLCFDADGLRKAINKDTKAIIITYLFGIVPNVDELLEISKKHDLFVLEDFSQCLNGEFNGKKIGTFGDVGIYSCSSMKTLDTYGGGMLICNNDELHDAMRKNQTNLIPEIRTTLIKKIITDLVRNLATTRFLFTVFVFPLLKLLSYTNPEKFIKQTGDRDKQMIDSLPDEWFSKFTSIQALAGMDFIKKIGSEDEMRIQNVNTIKSYVSPEVVKFPAGDPGAKNVYWQLIGYFNNPTNVQQSMHKLGVDTARSSLLQISDLKAYPSQGVTPNATLLYKTGFFVPAYSGLNAAEIERVIEAVNSLPKVGNIT